TEAADGLIVYARRDGRSPSRGATEVLRRRGFRMFESAELGHHVEDADYKRQEAKLRADLLDAQYDLLADASFPVVVLVNGVDGAGKGETVNLFNAWMDPRNIRSHAFGEPTEEERQRPPMWRFWR